MNDGDAPAGETRSGYAISIVLDDANLDAIPSPDPVPNPIAEPDRNAISAKADAERAPESTPALADAIAEVLADAMERLGVAPGAGVGVMLTGAETLRRLNREHRGRDATTDVLSFRADLEPGGSVWSPEEEPPYLGDIAIAVPVAAAAATAAGHPLRAELRLLAVHGLLHLLGHDDADDAGAEAMERLERELGVRSE